MTFQRPQLFHEYVKSNNKSYAVIFENLLDETRQTWNVSGTIKKFYDERVKGTSQILNSTITLDSPEEWKYFYAVRMMIGSENEFDWYPEKVGSFFVNWLLKMISTSNGIDLEDKVSLLEQFDSTFIVPEMNISVLNFAHLHTLNDFKQLLVSEDIANKLGSGTTDVEIENYLANFPSSFYKCFDQEKSYFEGIKFEANPENEEPYMLKSPCIEKRNLNVCADYCNWSNESQYFFSETNFLSLMKYALPQPKILSEQDESEYEMMAKIVGKESLLKKPKVAPMPLIILCKYQKNKGWVGQDIGMDVKFCDNFVQVPSDVGVCVSGAIDTSNIFTSDFYHDDNKSMKIKGGTIYSSATFFLEAEQGMESYPFPIKMQLHQRSDLAQILLEFSQDHNTRPFTLIRGNEYTFEVGIDGRIITQNFRELPIDRRKCKLPNEVADNFWFKHYSKRQCKYQCRTILAFNACGCIPWDIFRVGSYPKCDIFGRTCFRNVMENITNTDVACKDCHNDCLYLRYRYKVTKSAMYMQENIKFLSDGCNGMKALCNYVEDKNHTLNDKYSPGENEIPRLNRMIVVNIVFPTSEADLTVMDVRYTLIDKITSLGGSFGLFTQFTGCSIIAVIHLIILTTKQICIFFKDLKSKLCRRN